MYVQNVFFSEKYDSNLSYHWALFTARDRLQLIFQRVEFIKTGFISYLADFHDYNWRIPGFDLNKTQH